MIDQLTYSFTNFALTALIARQSDTHQFGVYALLLATFVIASSVNRGLNAEPVIIQHSNAQQDEWHLASVRGLRRSLVLGLAVGLASAAVTATVLPPNFLPLGYVFSAAFPVLFTQDFLRYAALARARPGLALANDAIVAVLGIGLAAAAITIGDTSASIFTGIWIFSSMVGGLAGMFLLGLAPVRFRDGWRAGSRGLAARLGLDNALLQLAQQGTSYVVAGVAGLAAAGGLRAAQTAYSPSAILSLGVQSAVIPEFVRARQHSLVAMLRAMIFVGLGLLLSAVIFLIGIPALPNSVGTAVLGPSWFQARPVLVYIGAAQVVAIPAGIAQAGLRTLADGVRTLRARVIGVLLFGLAAIPSASFAGLEGAGIGIAIGSAAQSVVWTAYFARSFRSHRDAENFWTKPASPRPAITSEPE